MIPVKEVPSGSSNNKFAEILTEKTEKKQETEAQPTMEQTREKLRALLEGGASPDEVVRTALAGHPLVDRLPIRLKEQLVRNVTTTMAPTLKSRV